MGKNNNIFMNGEWHKLGSYLYKVIPPANKTVTIYLNGSGQFTIFFGDGSSESYNLTYSDDPVQITHVYPNSDTYSVSIVGELSLLIKYYQFEYLYDLELEDITGVPENIIISKSYMEILDFFTKASPKSISVTECENLKSVDVRGISWLENLVCSNNENLESIDIGGCFDLINFQGKNNNLSSATVDNILSILNEIGNTGGTLDLSGNAPPTAEGLNKKITLQNKGWTVITD